MSAHETVFTANVTQRAFIESRAEGDLFAARKGEGKSAGLCWAAYYYTRHNPGAQGLCLRDTWENLRRTTLDEFFHWFPDGVYGQWMGSNKEWHWDTKRTGLSGKLTFMGAESRDDAQRIASMPLAYGLVDEPAPAAGSSEGVDEFIFDTMMAQMRQPGMNWYAMKLATNNPSEEHWSYKRFVRPGTPPDTSIELLPLQESGYRCWQTREPENVGNLPPGYYESMAKRWSGQKDLLRRFVEGKFGFQSKGKAVTPEWSDEIHLASGLQPVQGLPLVCLWDGGLNPTCIVTQVTPLGDWLILDGFTEDGIGVFELIEDVVKPRIVDRFPWVVKMNRGIKHTGDPNMDSGEQTYGRTVTAAKYITRELGGPWLPGPGGGDENRVQPLRAVMRKTRDGRGVMMVDRENAQIVWYALRGGWHRRVQRSGVVGTIVKDEHSHPGDAMGYGAALLFPAGNLTKRKKPVETHTGNYFNASPGGNQPFIGAKGRGIVVPKEAYVLGDGRGVDRDGKITSIGKRELPMRY